MNPSGVTNMVCSHLNIMAPPQVERFEIEQVLLNSAQSTRVLPISWALWWLFTRVASVARPSDDERERMSNPMRLELRMCLSWCVWVFFPESC